MATFNTLEDLECWELARELRINIMDLVKTFPGSERFRLSDLMIRSSSVGYSKYR